MGISYTSLLTLQNIWHTNMGSFIAERNIRYGHRHITEGYWKLKSFSKIGNGFIYKNIETSETLEFSEKELAKLKTSYAIKNI